MDKKQNPEISSLSVESLDVRELEARIELAASAADRSCNGGCTNNCYKPA